MTRPLLKSILGGDGLLNASRALYFLRALASDEAAEALVPPRVATSFLPFPLARGRWPAELFVRDLAKAPVVAVVQLEHVSDIMLALAPAPFEYNLEVGTVNIGPAGCGLVHLAYRCSRNSQQAGDGSGSGKCINCPARIDFFFPLGSGPASFGYVLVGPPHAAACGDSKFLALAPKVEDFLLRHLNVGAVPIHELLCLVSARVCELGKVHDAAVLRLLTTGASVPDYAIASARARGAVLCAERPAAISLDLPSCVCGATASFDGVGGSWLQCASAVCGGSFEGWYHLKCMNIKKAPEGDWVCPHCTAGLPSVLTRVAASPRRRPRRASPRCLPRCPRAPLPSRACRALQRRSCPRRGRRFSSRLSPAPCGS